MLLAETGMQEKEVVMGGAHVPPLPCTRGEADRHPGWPLPSLQTLRAHLLPRLQPLSFHSSASLLTISSWISIRDAESSKFSIHRSSANRVASRVASV